MGEDAHPPQEPVTSGTGSGFVEPIFLPVLRRPLGWRELDSKTLLSRAHGLIAAQHEPIVWHQANESNFQDIRLTRPLDVFLAERRQPPSSEHSLSPESSRIQAIFETPPSDPEAKRDAHPNRGERYSGWLLSASLILVVLQMALFLVAINPIEVIDNVKQSIRQWHISHPKVGVAGPGAPLSEGVSQPTERANWWTSWQQTSFSGVFSTSHEVPKANVQNMPQTTDVEK